MENKNIYSKILIFLIFLDFLIIKVICTEPIFDIIDVPFFSAKLRTGECSGPTFDIIVVSIK
jgi:hypothetical protein